MTEIITSDETIDAATEASGVSRRSLFLGGVGAVAGAGALMGALQHGVAEARPMQVETPRPDVLGTVKPYLQYIGIDAQAFTARSSTSNNFTNAHYEDITGASSLNWTTNQIWASLSIPAGSVIREINVAYQGNMTIDVVERKMSAPSPLTLLNLPNLPSGVGASTTTLVLDGSGPLAQPVTISPTSTYTIEIFGSAGASVYGVTIGYVPPTQSFIPFTGAPRILDTRDTGGGGKLAPGEERTIALGFPGARSAVLNLTLAETEGVGGFVAVFPANIAWPNNSSINWTGANQFIANGVITALDPSGQIKIRGGSQRTQVIIDRIGWLV